MNPFFKNGTPESMMRLVLFICCLTASFVALGTIVGFILGIVFGRDLTTFGGVIGAIAGVIGTLLTPTALSKAIQSFSENKGTTDENK
jgi:putative Mn2+ efflux pump MntP